MVGGPGQLPMSLKLGQPECRHRWIRLHPKGESIALSEKSVWLVS